ncbi:hypothetical protein SAY87_002368 [Trapa incisa]|uniref:Uncharacterized protein n=1 Tax=Trapa incisa TaxID=236973 RepID=A0AAN7PUX8_9MYRT|nr:hypothetical protein SAY87_002368 [Trapa incisa]
MTSTSLCNPLNATVTERSAQSSQAQAMASLHHSHPPFDELQWVIRIRRTLTDDLEDETDLQASIFTVPKALKSGNSEPYTPQEVALGPYHHWRPELREMERRKLAAARRVRRSRRGLGGPEFQALAEELAGLEGPIRDCYHRHLHLNGETLGWMMVIDGSFVLEFLQLYRKSSAHNAVILRDMVMLENQIPMFVLRKIVEFHMRSSPEESGAFLCSMLTGLCRELNPFEAAATAEGLPDVKVSESAHLLDFLYQMILPKTDWGRPSEIGNDDHDEAENGEQKPSPFTYAKQLVEEVMNNLRRLASSKPLRAVLMLPWKIISNLPVISAMKQTIEYLFFDEPKEDQDRKTATPNVPPTVEEIAIPSVTELSKSGVRFVATTGSLTSIRFDHKMATFHLPSISLDMNSEVVMRNLVAYEAAAATVAACGPLAFARYTELMNGIVDTEEDAKYLRERGIIVNHLKSDREVAKLWNGMNKSIRLTQVRFMDRAIEDVNNYYGGRWRVRVGKFFNGYVLGSWQILTFLMAVAVVLLLTLQAFCSVFGCSRASPFPSGPR